MNCEKHPFFGCSATFHPKNKSVCQNKR